MGAGTAGRRAIAQRTLYVQLVEYRCEAIDVLLRVCEALRIGGLDAVERPKIRELIRHLHSRRAVLALDWIALHEPRNGFAAAEIPLRAPEALRRPGVQSGRISRRETRERADGRERVWVRRERARVEKTKRRAQRNATAGTTSGRGSDDAPETRARIGHVNRDLLQHGKLQRRVAPAAAVAAAVAAHAVRAHRDAAHAHRAILAYPRVFHDFHRVRPLEGDKLVLHGLHGM